MRFNMKSVKELLVDLYFWDDDGYYPRHVHAVPVEEYLDGETMAFFTRIIKSNSSEQSIIGENDNE